MQAWKRMVWRWQQVGGNLSSQVEDTGMAVCYELLSMEGRIQANGGSMALQHCMSQCLVQTGQKAHTGDRHLIHETQPC